MSLPWGEIEGFFNQLQEFNVRLLGGSEFTVAMPVGVKAPELLRVTLRGEALGEDFIRSPMTSS